VDCAHASATLARNLFFSAFDKAQSDGKLVHAIPYMLLILMYRLMSGSEATTTVAANAINKPFQKLALFIPLPP
jgi:hypothetical protein